MRMEEQVCDGGSVASHCPPKPSLQWEDKLWKQKRSWLHRSPKAVASNLRAEVGFTEASPQAFGTHCHRPRQLAGAFSGTFENHSIFQWAVGNDHLGYFRLRPQGLFSSSSWSSPSLFSQSSPSRPVSSNVHVKHLYSQNIYHGSIFLSKPTPIWYVKVLRKESPQHSKRSECQ